MSLRLRLRLLLSTMLGALFVVAVGSALQFREIATVTTDVLGADAQVLAATAEMQRLLGEPDHGRTFEQAFLEQLALAGRANADEAERAAVARVAAAFETYVIAGPTSAAAEEEAEIRAAVAALGSIAVEQATRTARSVEAEANKAALGLGVLAALVVVLGAWASRAVRVSLFDPLTAIDRAVVEVQQGDTTRRLGLRGNDELARVAAALDSVLDSRDRAEAAVQGRNRELRALLVATLHHWPKPAAVTGIDGEIIVSTLEGEEEEALRAIAPQLRAAARTLLSRKFLAAAELATDIRVDATHFISIRALALGEQRIVGWLAVFNTRGQS